MWRVVVEGGVGKDSDGVSTGDERCLFRREGLCDGECLEDCTLESNPSRVDIAARLNGIPLVPLIQPSRDILRSVLCDCGKELAPGGLRNEKSVDAPKQGSVSLNAAALDVVLVRVVIGPDDERLVSRDREVRFVMTDSARDWIVAESDLEARLRSPGGFDKRSADPRFRDVMSTVIFPNGEPAISERRHSWSDAEVSPEDARG